MSLPPPTPEREIDDGDSTRFTVFDEDAPKDPTFEDTEHWETFERLMSELPVKHARCADIEHPRQFLDAVLGAVTSEFIEGIGEVRAQSYDISEGDNWAKVMIAAAQVARTTPAFFFNKLLTPEDDELAPCSQQYKTELEYLRRAHAESDVRKYNVTAELLRMSGTYAQHRRMEWTACLIKLVHLCMAIFKPAMRSAMGTKASVVKRHEKIAAAPRDSEDFLLSYREPRRAAGDFARGELYELDVFIYEVLVHLALPNIHLNSLTRISNLLCLSEYHAVRCALDASSSTILYICLMSPQYMLHVWLPYMKLYYPKMFKEEEDTREEVKRYREASVLPRWTHLELYLPSKYVGAPQNPENFVPFLQMFFGEMLAPEFRRSFTSVTMPRDYLLLRTPPGEIFTVGCRDSIAFRRPKRASAPKKGAFALKRARTE